MSKTYYVLYQSEDSPHIETISETELLARLNSEYWGSAPKFRAELPKFVDGYFILQGITIIEGRVVMPQAVKTVTEYVLP